MSVTEKNTEPKLKRGRQSESEREGNEDRLSNLPDSLVLHILSFVKCRTAVRTCVLSRRWKDLWRQLPCLFLDSLHFRTIKIFRKFVYKVLSLRDGSLALHTLDFRRHGIIQPWFLRTVLKYAISHEVRELGIYVEGDITQLPSSLFLCKTLTSLKLRVEARNVPDGRLSLRKSLKLPALTTLHLSRVAFFASENDRAEPFLGCIRLNNLVLDRCALRDAKVLCISSATLSCLVIYDEFYKIILSTPSLCSFTSKVVNYRHISGNRLTSSEQVNIDGDTEPSSERPSIILDLLIGLTNVQSLTMTEDTLQILALIPDLLKTKLHSLGNLKSLKVIMRSWSRAFDPVQAAMSQEAKKKVSSCLPDGIVDFLLQNSPSAEVSLVKWGRLSIL